MPQTISLSNEDVYTTCYHKVTGESCLDVSEHALVYVARGNMDVLVDNIHKATITEGGCVFVRKDHRTTLVQNPSDEVGFHLSIVLFFPRHILFDFYKTLREEDLPKRVHGLRESISPLTSSLRHPKRQDGQKEVLVTDVRGSTSSFVLSPRYSGEA